MSFLISENEGEPIDYKSDYFSTAVGTFGVSGFNMDGQEVGNFCYVCKAQFTGIANCRFHFEGRRHSAKLKQYNDSTVQLIIDPIGTSAGESKDDEESLYQEKYCKVCEAELNTFEQREAHYNSEKHQRRVRNYVFIQMGLRDVTAPTPVATKVVEDPSSLSSMQYCTLCKIELTAPVVAHAHYNGKKHAKKMREKLSRDKDDTLRKYRCEVCDCDLNSEDQYNKHKESGKHLKKAKMSSEILDKKIMELQRQKQELARIAAESANAQEDQALDFTSETSSSKMDDPKELSGDDPKELSRDDPKELEIDDPKEVDMDDPKELEMEVPKELDMDDPKELDK